MFLNKKATTKIIMAKGKSKKQKKVHQNKYENAPRGPKKQGRNKSSYPHTSIDDFVKVSPTIPETREIKTFQGMPDYNSTYWQYDDWQVQETFSDWNGNINLYASNKVDLVLHDPKARLCLLVGAWQTSKLFRNQIKGFKTKTGAVIESYENKALGIRTALAYSTNPEEVKEHLNPDAKILVDFPRGSKGTNLLICHGLEGSNSQDKLNKIMLHYLQKADANYFKI